MEAEEAPRPAARTARKAMTEPHVVPWADFPEDDAPSDTQWPEIRMRWVSPTTYTVTYIDVGWGLAQAEGVTNHGRPFYFRAKRGEWTVDLGPQGAPPEYLTWADDDSLNELSARAAGGPIDATRGEYEAEESMTESQVRAILDSVLPMLSMY